MTNEKQLDRHFIQPHEPSYWKARRQAFDCISELERLIAEREAIRRRLRELSASVEGCAIEIAWNPNVVSILRAKNNLSLLTGNGVQLEMMEKAHKAIAAEYKTKKDALAECERREADYEKAKRTGNKDEIETAAEEVFHAEGYYHLVSSGDLGRPIDVLEAELAHMSDEEREWYWDDYVWKNARGTAEDNRYYKVFSSRS